MAEKTIRNYWNWSYWHVDPNARCPKCGNDELSSIVENGEALERVICLKCRWEGPPGETGYLNPSMGMMVKEKCPKCGHREQRFILAEDHYEIVSKQCLKCGAKNL